MRYLFAAIVAFIFLSASYTLNAQVRVNINFNLDSQPAWGPTGYDYVEYYYLPDIDVYYSVPLHRYYYYNRGHWIYSSTVPSRYHNYNFYNSHKVVVNEREPWRNDKTYREKYSQYKDRHDQQPIRDSKDSKYFANKYHPEHKNWVKQQKQEKNKNKAQGKGNKPKENNKQDKHSNQGNQDGHKNHKK